MSLEAWGDELPDEGVFDAAIDAGWIDPDDLSQAALDVLAERDRQINSEGFAREHDDAHIGGELACAAACYVINAAEGYGSTALAPLNWPWHLSWWKPEDPRRDLVKAAALIIAEIERRDRAEAVEE